jgi:hypothetical protein
MDVEDSTGHPQAGLVPHTVLNDDHSFAQPGAEPVHVAEGADKADSAGWLPGELKQVATGNLTLLLQVDRAPGELTD